MDEIALKAQVREKTGKGIAKKLRRQGLIPAILYGPGISPLPLAINPNYVIKALKAEQTATSFFDLEIEGKETKKVKVFIKDFDVHPVTDEIIHVDFYQIAMDKEISVEVPIILKGKPKGVERGGILEQNLREITVTALPDKIPAHIELDVSGLDIGDSIHIAELQVPEGIKIEDDPQIPVGTLVAPEEETTEEAEGEGEET